MMNRRYSGQALPDSPRIAVISNDAIGNFVAATPLLQMLRSNFPSCHLTSFGGTRIAELADASDLFEAWFELHGSHPGAVAQRLTREVGVYDLVVNMERDFVAKFTAMALVGQNGFVSGPCLREDGRGDLAFPDDPQGDLARDMEWIAEDLTTKYPFLDSGFICEIVCRMAYLKGPVPPYKLPTADPGMEIPDVLIATSASLPEKLWPTSSWMAALSALKSEGVSVGLLGAKPKDQSKYWLGSDLESELVENDLVIDLRGKLTMPQVVGALAQTKKVLTLDNGILHLAVAGGKPVVGLYRYGIHRLWAPPSENLTGLYPQPGKPVSEIPVEAVLKALKR
jgi:ADP-heptose:LPS heptosyltransferase